MTGQKRIIVVISDGLDRGSKATFEQTLAELQAENIMVYAVQAVDRTRGAIRRDVPKPKVVIDKLAEANRRTDLFDRRAESGGESNLRRAATESLRAFVCSVECAVWAGAQFVSVG